MFGPGRARRDLGVGDLEFDAGAGDSPVGVDAFGDHPRAVLDGRAVGEPFPGGEDADPDRLAPQRRLLGVRVADVAEVTAGQPEETGAGGREHGSTTDVRRSGDHDGAWQSRQKILLAGIYDGLNR